ncbi:IclR family transcriptional regulator [Halalkalibacterium ligniniphilum]|uniref:IclR family transcriptional regulator n=1 Tax=Halalkalibacterium ligniniphilum TaxID=1134413 RepID=UPI00034CD8AF|nr:IclR family transcriptional regulator [Halalkalibacterium ligniniphilum]
MKERDSKVQSVERAMSILECFTIEEPEQSLSELSKKTALNKSTVYRLLATLESMDYIKQNELTSKYSLGFKFFHLGSVVMSNMELRTIAYPFMKELSEKTLETISLNIVEGDERVCIEIVESPLAIRNFSKVGQRNRLWVGASGKVLLGSLKPEEQRHILTNAIKNNLIEEDVDKLQQELSEIQQQGYAVVINERVDGSFAVATPIFDYKGQLVGSLTAAGPLQRLSDDRIPLLIEQVVKTGHSVSESLGYKLE